MTLWNLSFAAYFRMSLLSCAVGLPGALVFAIGDDEQTRKDRIVVEALMRLDGVDVNSDEKLSATVRRYLARIENDPSQLKIIDKLKIRGYATPLIERAISWGATTQSVQALQLALEQGGKDSIADILDVAELNDRADAISKVLALCNRREAHELQRELVQRTNVAKSIRVDATVGLSRSTANHGFLIELARKDALPAEAKSLIGATLRASEDAAIRTAATELFPPIKTSGAALPPIEQLAKRNGNANQGRQLYFGAATCSQCHMIGNEGKNVGPSLTEIGNKLPKDAMYVAILSPSAGISHNYESYAAKTNDGEIITGLLVSKTSEGVTLKDSKGIEHTIPTSELEAFQKQEKSLMPENLQETMNEQGLVDLVEFLLTLKKPS